MSEKLQKVLARAGFGSRREIETWISQGRIKVNGKVAEIGARVSDEDKIIVDGKKLTPQKKIRLDRRVLLQSRFDNDFCGDSASFGSIVMLGSWSPLLWANCCK